ncbi:hypothetical protein EDD11_007177 [Mortierella claussenii]|nr:hypothetical protein EDD11_007177 [Mortierella claussenii]
MPSESSSGGRLFKKTPSIRIKKSKDKDKYKEKTPGAFSNDPPLKVSLKRSRSPIKLLKNIKSYLHVHKHRYSSGHSSSNGNGPFQPQHPNSNQFNNSLAPPPRSSFETGSSGTGYQYRPASLPSSSILSAACSLDDASLQQQQPQSLRERPPSESLSPEKQVLLLQVMSYFEHAGHRADEETAAYLLSSYQWDIDQTMQYCQDLVQAVQGTLVPVQQETPLSGAINDQMTSCYIDALLFAMFARLSAFEGLLNVNLDVDSDSDSEGSGSGTEGVGPTGTTVDTRRGEEKQEALLHTHLLQTWLRMFVNQLRSGRLIQAHVVKEFRQHLYSCGWNCPGPYDPPGSSRQEDSSELFMFLTEKLHLPYLPLEQRLLHGAKISVDDDKVITERMLQISIPTPEPSSQDSSPTTSRLESAFSKLLSSKPSSSGTNGNINNNNGDLSSAASSTYEVLSLENLLAQHFYDNTLTGIRRLVSSGTGVPLSPGVEVPVSAWQVLELLPFYSSSNEQGGIIHASQSQYPADVVILPLILKRYSFGYDMQARRTNTPIDIPRRIDFSRFVNRQTSTSSFGAAAAAAATEALATTTMVESPSSEIVDAIPVITNGNEVASATIGIDNEKGAAMAQLEVPEAPSNPPTSSLESSTQTSETLTPTLSPNVSTVGSSLSVHNISSVSINTSAGIPPLRKYSMSLLQAVDSPRTPMTPPPQYSPASSSKSPLAFMNNNPALGDEKKGWSPMPPPDGPFESGEGGDYMDCRQPKVKYMLELKSVVCHIGSRLDSGHYRSYVADQVGKDNTSGGHAAAASSGASAGAQLLSFQEPNWLRHDDLDPSGNRVQLIPRDSVENMDMEADWARNGYILFYELQTIHL